MIRNIYNFKYSGKKFRCGDLLWRDYLLLLFFPKEGLTKILLEYNKKLPKLNNRQAKNFLKILMNVDDKKKYNKKNVDYREVIENQKDQMMIIEGILMSQLHISREEIQHMTFRYVMRMLELLPVIAGNKEYNEIKDEPDRKKLKQLGLI